MNKISGVGINDADYIVSPTVDGKQLDCPFYVKWQNMLERCYSPYYLNRVPSYQDVTVCEEWLTFSSFKRWMESQVWEGMELDKDTLIFGNRVYSPEACVFVTGDINMLTRVGTGKFPGANPHRKGYQAWLRIKGKPNYLGKFPTKKEASDVYVEAKSRHIVSVALHQENKVFMGLLKHAVQLRRQLAA